MAKEKTAARQLRARSSSVAVRLVDKFGKTGGTRGENLSTELPRVSPMVGLGKR